MEMRITDLPIFTGCVDVFAAMTKDERIPVQIRDEYLKRYDDVLEKAQQS